MKNILILGALAVALLNVVIAEARPVRSNERWCLNVKEGWEGGGHYNCNYATYDQCMASRTANGEWCMLNPEFATPQGYFYR